MPVLFCFRISQQKPQELKSVDQYILSLFFESMVKFFQPAVCPLFKFESFKIAYLGAVNSFVLLVSLSKKKIYIRDKGCVVKSVWSWAMKLWGSVHLTKFVFSLHRTEWGGKLLTRRLTNWIVACLSTTSAQQGVFEFPCEHNVRWKGSCSLKRVCRRQPLSLEKSSV